MLFVSSLSGLGVLMLGKRLGPVKWSACFLLAFGIMVVQACPKGPGRSVLSDPLRWISLDDVELLYCLILLLHCRCSYLQIFGDFTVLESYNSGGYIDESMTQDGWVTV